MKITEVSVMTKRSKNYQTYAVGMKASIDLERGELAEEAIRLLQQKCTLLADQAMLEDEMPK